MKEKIKYELKKQSCHFRYFLWTNILINLLSLMFFSLVSYFEKNGEDSIITSSIGIISLASTLTVSIAIIYGVVIWNRSLLRHYIGSAREIIYLFPGGRGEIFISKIIALSLLSFINLVSVLFSENLIFYFVGKSLGFVAWDLFIDILKITYMTIFVGIFSLTIILISILIGQVFQSTNISIIASIIIVSIMSNMIAFSYKFNSGIILILIIGIFILNYFIKNILSRRVKNDDIIENISS